MATVEKKPSSAPGATFIIWVITKVSESENRKHRKWQVATREPSGGERLKVGGEQKHHKPPRMYFLTPSLPVCTLVCMPLHAACLSNNAFLHPFAESKRLSICPQYKPKCHLHFFGLFTQNTVYNTGLFCVLSGERTIQTAAAQTAETAFKIFQSSKPVISAFPSAELWHKKRPVAV